MRPTERNIRIAGAVIAALGIVACLVAIFSEQLGLGEEAARGMFGWKRVSLLVAGALAAGVGALLAAVPGAIARRIGDERVQTLANSLLLPSDRQLGYLTAGLLAVLGLALIWTRLLHLNQSFWHDEVYTVANFSSVGPSAILLWDSFHFNNHAFYNFLSWLTVSVFGPSEAMYRFWSVVPAIAAIAVVTWWAWVRLGRLVAVAFATITVASPIHLEYAPQARGYGLALLAASLMLVVADRLTRAYSHLNLAGFIGAGVLGVWTLITFAVVFVAQVVSLLRWPHLRLPMAVTLGAVAAVGLALYIPVLGGVIGAGVGGETIPLLAALLLDRPLEWMVIPTITLLTGAEGRPGLEGIGVAAGAPWGTWIDVLVFALFAGGLIALWRRGHGGLALMLLLPPLLFNLFLSIDQQATTVRHQFFLLPYVILPVAVGIAEVGRLIARPAILRPVAIGAGVVLVLALSAAIVEKEERRDLPRENFKEVARVVDGTGIDTIITDSHRPDGLVYYVGGELTQLSADEVEAILCDRDQEEFVYIRHIPFPPNWWGFWRPASLDCLEGRDAARVRVRQRMRGFAIDVWIVRPVADDETAGEDLPFAEGP